MGFEFSGCLSCNVITLVVGHGLFTVYSRDELVTKVTSPGKKALTLTLSQGRGDKREVG